MLFVVQVVDLEQSQELTYYASENDSVARGTIMVADALVSNITIIKERENSFSIQTAPDKGSSKTYFLSSSSLEESLQWQ